MGQFEVRARLKIHEGQLEGFKRQAAEIMRQAREKDTGTVAYDWFLSSDGTQCEVREAYMDAEAFVEHAFHVREARDTLFGEFAYDHQMTISPVLHLRRLPGGQLFDHYQASLERVWELGSTENVPAVLAQGGGR